MKYKKVKKLVPYCDKCEVEITGNGSVMLPYGCKCGDYVWDEEKKDYVLEAKK